MDAKAQLPGDKQTGGHNIIHNAGNDTVFQMQILLALQYMKAGLVDRFRNGYSLVEGDDALGWVRFSWSATHLDKVNTPHESSTAPKTNPFLERARGPGDYNDNDVDQKQGLWYCGHTLPRYWS
jgi:hypothetical protein